VAAKHILTEGEAFDNGDRDSSYIGSFTSYMKQGDCIQ
jgi:hypothetical protein